MTEVTKTLINRVEAFIKKFYLNALIRGILMSAMLLSVLVLVVNALEYFGWFPGWMRLTLLLLFAAVFLFVFIFYLAIPSYKLIRYRKQMQVEEAARLIGIHFPEVNDRLVNTLQLLRKNDHDAQSDLLNATLEQRISQMRFVPFVQAVNLKSNLNILRYAVVPVVVLLAVILFLPAFISKPAERILRFDKTYIKPLPFEVVFPYTDLSTLQNEDFQLEVLLKGEAFPDEFFVELNGGRYQMQKLTANQFIYTFRKPAKSLQFSISGGKYNSGSLLLEVRPKPILMSFESDLVFPAYTGLPQQRLKEKTRLAVPEGTQIQWQFFARDTDSLLLSEQNDSSWLQRNDNSWRTEQDIRSEKNFTIRPINRFSKNGEQLSFTVEMIPDAYPDIMAEKLGEEFSKNIFFTGIIADDYGFTDLKFKYQIVDPDSQEESNIFEFLIPVSKSELRQDFYFTLNLDSLNMVAGDQLTGHFEVRDNDAVNGAKMRQSKAFVVAVPSRNEIDSIAKQKDKAIAERIENLKNESSDIKKEIDQLLKDLVNKKELDWNDKQKLNQLQEKMQSAQSEWEELNKERMESRQFEKENETSSEELLKKQERIDQLLEEVIPDELKAMMEELQKLLEDMPREKMQEMLQQLKQDQTKMEDLLDRNLKLLEQLKVEKDMNELIEKLQDLGEKLEKEAEMKKSEDQSDSSSLKKDQDAFEKMTQELDSIQKKNEALERPFKLEDTDQTEEEIQDAMEEAGEQMKMNNNSGANTNKKKAGKKMKEMANMLQMSMAASMMEQQMEDAHAMRLLLENVLRSSLNQEDLMLRLGSMRADDPSLPGILTQQRELQENFRIVEDSLKALAARQPMIEQFIFDELANVRFRVSESLLQLKDAQQSKALGSQQFSLMAINKLALMLSESLENMQNSMGMPSGMPSQGQPKPGQQKGQQSMQNMRQMQEALGKQLDQMRKEAQSGKNGDPKSKQSEELARMAAQQEAIRQGMQEMLNELKSQGLLNEDGLQQIIEEMEKLEEDLVNKRVNSRLMERQKEIETRMLESEKAMQQREQEKKRESNEFKGENFGNLVEDFEYKSILKLQQERLRLSPLDLQPYYKKKVNGYLLRKNAGSYPKN